MNTETTKPMLTDEESQHADKAVEALAAVMALCHLRGDDQTGVQGSLCTMSAALGGMRITVEMPVRIEVELKLIEELCDGLIVSIEQHWQRENGHADPQQ